MKTIFIKIFERLMHISKIPLAQFKSISVIDDFCFYKNIKSGDIVVDVGCADDPQVGSYFERKGCLVYLVDPTLKHKPALEKIVNSSSNYDYLPVAVGANDGLITFFEPENNKSGSLQSDHRNAKKDGISYKVEVLSILSIKERISAKKISFMKLDLEGAEYDLIRGSTEQTWNDINQLFVEFHHHCTSYTYKDTEECIEKLKKFGFSIFKIHKDVFLFYRK